MLHQMQEFMEMYMLLLEQILMVLHVVVDALEDLVESEKKRR